MNPRLHQKVIIVTGGASGIGRATVERLLADGASVVFGDVNVFNSVAFVEQLRPEFGDRVRFFPCDVGQEADFIRLIEFTRETFGRLDVFVNNAGCGGALSSLLDTSLENWDRTQQIILRSVFLGTTHAARAMIEQGQGGAIINMASLAAFSAGAGGAAYSTAKAGVVNLTRVAAANLGQYRIRVNSIAPGTILTPLITKGEDDDKFREGALLGQPWPEAGRPHHVAPVIAFLCGDETSFVTGENIIIDGGMCAAGGTGNVYGGPHPLGDAFADVLRKKRVASFDNWSSALSRDGRNVVVDGRQFLTPAQQQRRCIVIADVGTSPGRDLARKFIDWGHQVIGCDTTAARLAPLREQYSSPHRFDEVDTSSPESLSQWVADLERAGIAPDLLLCHARESHDARPLWKVEPAEFQRVLQANLLAPAALMQQFVPGMLRRRRGVIVALLADEVQRSAARMAPLHAAQVALQGAVHSLSHELPPFMSAVSLTVGLPHLRLPGENSDPDPLPREWAELAAAYLLTISPRDNGLSLAIPGIASVAPRKSPESAPASSAPSSAATRTPTAAEPARV